MFLKRRNVVSGNSSQVGNGWGSGNALNSLTAFLPSGLSLYSDTTFDNPWNGTATVDGWYIANNISKLSRELDSSGGYGPWVTRFDFDAGSTGDGNGSGTIQTSLAANPLNYKRVYWAVRHLFSSNYVAHSNRSGGEKFFYPLWNGSALTQAPYICFVGQPTTCVGPFALVTLDWTGWVEGSGSPPTILLTDYVIPAGQWADIAIEYIIGDSMTANTVVRIWVNGVQVCNKTDLTAYNGDPDFRMTFMRYDTTRGGGVSNVPVPAGGMFRKVDRMVLYGSTT